MDDKNLNFIVGCVGLLISVCLVFSGFGRLSKSKNFERKAVEVQATVSQVSKYGDHYSIYVSYEYNGMKYSNVHLTNDGMLCKVGDKESVLIDPDNPNVCTTSNSLSPASYVFIMGGFILGLIMVVKILEARK